jgi:hypothetical protein
VRFGSAGEWNPPIEYLNPRLTAAQYSLYLEEEQLRNLRALDDTEPSE